MPAAGCGSDSTEGEPADVGTGSGTTTDDENPTTDGGTTDTGAAEEVSGGQATTSGAETSTGAATATGSNSSTGGSDSSSSESGSGATTSGESSSSGTDSTGEMTESSETSDAVEPLCHDYGFAGDAVPLRQVDALPTMDGGEIIEGTYVAVDAQTTGSLQGTIRSTWVFESEGIMQIYEQLTLSGTPVEPTPRTLSWSVEGAELSRQQICGGDQGFTNGYRVRSAEADVFLEVRTGSIMFVYQRLR